MSGSIPPMGGGDDYYYGNRRIARHAASLFDTEGKLISEEAFEAKRTDWLPTDEEREYVKSLMKPVLEPGKFANYIAPPRRGINRQDVDFEYVRTDG